MGENALSRTSAPSAARIEVKGIKRVMRRCAFLMGIAALVSSILESSPVLAGIGSADEAVQRIQQLIQQGDLAGARSQLTQSLKDFPGEVGFYNLLGVVEAQQGNYRAAESNFIKATEHAPRFTGAYLNLGRLYQENLGKDPTALRKGIQTYEKLLSYEPSNVEANYQSAVLLQLQGSFKSSLDRLSHLPASAQQRAQALAVRCADLGALGDLSQANVTAEQLLSSPELAEADVLSILPTLRDHQQNALEVRLLEGLVKRQLASSTTLRDLGLLYEQQGQLDRARETLENAAKGQPVSAALLLELARVANKQRDHQGTLGYLAHARDLEPQNAGIHFFFGMVCVELNLSQDAYNSLKQAVSLDPNNAYYNYALGAVTLHRKDPSDAIPYFQKYRELKPDDPRGKFALGSAYFYSSNYVLARKELQSVATNPETAAGAHYFLGRLAKQEDNLLEAGREFQQALQANPDYADAYAELGLVNLRQKDYAQAEKALGRALEIDPDNYLANLNLLNLFQRTKDKRADAQAQRFEEVKKKRSEKADELLRTIEIVRE